MRNLYTEEAFLNMGDNRGCLFLGICCFLRENVGVLNVGWNRFPDSRDLEIEGTLAKRHDVCHFLETEKLSHSLLDLREREGP